MSEKISADRRRGASSDRRRHPRSGRRATDPRANWRRVAWLFAGYAAYLSARSIGGAVRRLFRNRAA